MKQKDVLLWSLHLLRDPKQRKYFFRWVQSLGNDQFLKKSQPWLNFAAIDYLDSMNLDKKRVFEYGSGGSTLYWLSRKMQCVSIEHDYGWYDAVHNRVDDWSHIDYRLVQPEQVSESVGRDISDPTLYLSDNTSFKGYSFKNYVTQIDTFPDEYFDVVLIDGRSRSSCIMHSVKKIKLGGFLVLDNSDRSYYLDKTVVFLSGFERKTFSGTTPSVNWYTETSFFLRQK